MMPSNVLISTETQNKKRSFGDAKENSVLWMKSQPIEDTRVETERNVQLRIRVQLQHHGQYSAFINANRPAEQPIFQRPDAGRDL